MPPQKKEQPRTSNMLDRMEPSSVSCTTRIIPFLRAIMDIISSVTFPNVAFKRPPTGVKSVIARQKTILGEKGSKKQSHMLYITSWTCVTSQLPVRKN